MSSRWLSLLLSCALCSALGACPGPDEVAGADSGPPSYDAGQTDVAVADSALPDHAAAVDASSADRGEPDATQLPDAATPDLGTADQNTADAGAADLLQADSAAGPDISSPDSGSPDISSPDISSPDSAGGADAGCAEDATRCGDEGVERCVAGGWQLEEPCPQGCADATCVPDPVICTPDALRCYRNTVQRCNLGGTAWLYDSFCIDACEQGLCVGACEPDALRCNGDAVERCDGDGLTWVEEASCADGCRHSACVAEALLNQGVPMEMEGVYVYSGCVDVELGGEINVPAGTRLEIWARCLTLSASSSVNLGSGASFVFHAAETIDIDGSVGGGALVWLEAWQALVNNGALSSERVVLRADALTNGVDGTVSGSTEAAALYGAEWSGDGAHSGAVSVMPPAAIASATHPADGTWNLAGDGVNLSWERPFPSALGYYVGVGDAVPGPANAELVTLEHVDLPLELFHPGLNRVRVVSVNADSTLGTYPVDYWVTFNVASPRVSSTSHPSPYAWGGPDDVYLEWTDPEGIPASAWVGYYYVWDRYADTVPGPDNGTYRAEQSLLLPDQAPGVWFFHITVIDLLGRPAPLAAHYMVRVGPEPGYGNVAGTITDADSGAPLPGAAVKLNGGLLYAYSDQTGDYTFRNEIAAATDPYRVTASAPGYLPQERSVTVGAGSMVVENFALAPGGDARPYPLGWEIQIADAAAGNPAIAVGPPGRYLWSRVNAGSSEEAVAIVDQSGQEVMVEPTWIEYYNWGARTDVGWNGQAFYALEYYKCDDSGSMSFGHGWSCLRMKTWDAGGAAQHGWTAWRRSGHTGSPSAAWNGQSYGTFFISYSGVFHRELTWDMEFANGGDEIAVETVSTSYDDDRQFARTRAIWDGAGYAVMWQIGSSLDGSPHVYFARYGRDLTVLQAPINLDLGRSNPLLGLVYDGADYHVSYTRDGTQLDLVLRRVSAAGALSEPVVIADDVEWTNEVSLADDRRHLLLVYDVAGEGFLEVRATSDHGLVEQRALGPMVRPRIATNPTTGEAVIIYARPDRDGTFMRTLWTG